MRILGTTTARSAPDLKRGDFLAARGFMTTETLTWLIPLPPLLAFFLVILVDQSQQGLSHSVALAGAFLSWAMAMIVFVRARGCTRTGASALSVCRQLDTDRGHVAKGWSACGPALRHHPVLRGLDRADDLHLQRGLPQLRAARRRA